MKGITDILIYGIIALIIILILMAILWPIFSGTGEDLLTWAQSIFKI